MKSYKVLSTGLNSILETPEVNIKQEDTLPCDHFLHSPSERHHSSEWDFPESRSSVDYMQFERSASSGLMRGSVSSLADAIDIGPHIFDSINLDSFDRTNDSHFDILEGYCFLWESFKDDDMSPTSTSSTDATTTHRPSAASTASDEEAISSSNRLCDHSPDGQTLPLPKSKMKSSVDTPPDDVGAFFGHPLTRATNALNGEELDTNASAVALLHEYINLPPLEREDIQRDEKINGFLEIISSQRADPPLSTVQIEVNASSTPDSDTVVTADPEPQEINQRLEEEVEVETEGGYLFQDYAPLDKYNIEGNQAGGPAVTPANSKLQPLNTSTRCLRRSKSAKETQPVTGSALQKKPVSRRAPRRSRAKTDVVTSTSSCVTTPLGSEGALTTQENLATSGHHQQLVVGAGLLTIYPPPHQFETKGAVAAKRKAETVDEQGGIATTAPAREGLPLSYATTTQNTLSPQPRLLHYTSASELPQTTFQQQDSAVGPNPTSTESQLLTLVAHQNNSATRATESPSDLVSTTEPSSAPCSPTEQHVVTVSYIANEPKVKDGQENGYHFEQLVKENNFLKKALSDKIRSRQSTEEAVSVMPAHSLQFLTDDIHGSVLDSKYPPSIKQEHPSFMNYMDQQFYDSEIVNGQLAQLTNMNSCANAGHNLVSATMATCDDGISNGDSHSLTGLVNGSIHTLYSGALEHHDHRHPQHLAPNEQNMHDAMIVQSAGQYFQVLQPLQPLETPQTVDSQVSSTNPAGSNIGYYNYMYPGSNESEKHQVLECYHPHTTFTNNNFQNFLQTDSYNMKSPDSGYHEPCLSPNAMLKENPLNGAVENLFKDKTKKKKSVGNGAATGALMRQYSSSSCEKMSPKSPTVAKLEVNHTGYSYFLETPISTTQRKDEDKVTYLNKSQYYGLTLNFDTQERIIKCAVVKSVIILAFREDKSMEEERKAWEFWHGRQHSYKQRILDIDTKNCQGVLPHNIEEIAFNAVAVRWNPMDGPVRVNIAVHCLSTDFSNQKGVKGIPLHVQIDTYEQSPKENNLVHRGYCQIKAFCDKGAERKTRDEERRRVAKSKPEDFANGCTKTKGRKKSEEAFHDPCDRSEFYSMANTNSPPVFFNPLHETSEFIHKSITIGVVPSQEEDISSLPTSLELPDSCDDYYSNSPAKKPRRDSISAPKDSPKVLLYVREHHEEVYTALMLEIPTLHGLLKSIEQKYSISPSRVKNLYKKSRKGILVRLDDNIVRHYSHESTFIIEKNLISDDKEYEIILIEIDPPIM